MRLRAKLAKKDLVAATDMVAIAMSLSDRHNLAGLGTTGSSISNLVILDMVPF